MSKEVERLQELIDQYDNIVFFGGAGVSTESGIPDFRSQDGLYNQKYDYPPETILSHTFFMGHPEEFYRFYQDKMLCDTAKPNAAHLKLAELEEAGKLKAVITQNIDNLHERAGNRRVIHMHGELLKVRCSWSGQVLEWTGDVTAEDKCHCCQFPAALRPHVVWFGEMPLGMDEIYSALADADIFIAIGTSGHVYPAAGFVHEARLHGAHTVELNLEPSQVGSEFAEKHYGLASEVVPAFIDKLLQENAL